MSNQTGTGLIKTERDRQVASEGWSPEHDDKHTDGELRDAGIAYAIACDDRGDNPPSCWPWDLNFYRPDDSKTKKLVKAGALIAAEIDRHRRIFKTECNKITVRDFGFEVFDDMDAYELEDLDWLDVDPEAFISEHFAEDYDRLKYEEEQRREADEAQNEERDDGGEEED